MSQGDRAVGPAPHCPTCQEPIAWAGNRARPFCSWECKLIDLGGWLDERYRIGTEETATPPSGVIPADPDRPPGRTG